MTEQDHNWKSIEALFDADRKTAVDVDLKKSILNQIDMETYKSQEKKPEIRVVRSFWSRPVVRYGLLYILGIFTGLLLFTFTGTDFKKSVPDTSAMKGTLSSSVSFDDMKIADVLQYDSPLARAICNIRYSARMVEIRLDLSSLYPVKSTLEFESNSFQVINIQNINVNSQTTTMAASNFVQINNTGDNKFIIQLLNKNKLPHDIEFKIYQNDTPIYQNSAKVNKE
jgi:hypothetical protein